MSDDRIAQCRATALARPDDTENLWSWGHALLDANEAEEARSKFERIVELEPDDHESWHIVGVCFARSNLWPNAIFAYRRALDVYREFPDCWADLGDALVANGALHDARSAYESGLSAVLPNEEAHNQILRGLDRLS
ncbi:tetratricopeptide repeat protein [Neorhodopirellula lusitana]|nr:tetratricopeptide repeat protein [Neorhodopirellula lusitana]